ncbi:MAG: AAA family ATPase [Acidimicrobiia bacterium]|nr:AAA family ATPase [Acidimicrobiia bacterium]
MDDALLEVILERTVRSPLPTPAARDLLLAACAGDDHLDATLAGSPPPAPAGTSPSTSEPSRPIGAYLAGITVRGFRGVGPERALNLHPGPGLTVVVGRNGSGKSSFAEGLEVLLTGSTHRFDSTTVFRDGWRNRHEPTSTSVAADLHVEGHPGVTHLERRWADDASLDDGQLSVELPSSECHDGLDALGWAEHLVTHKPFLAHGELGAMFGRPSELHDRVAAVLGLGELVATQQRLAERRKVLERQAKETADERKALLTDLGELADPRAADAAALLAAKAPDFDALQDLAVGTSPVAAGGLAVLRRLSTLTCPTTDEVEAAATELDTAADELDALTGSAAGEARALADLLDAALRHHDDHPDERECPVCGRSEALTTAWADEARATVADLRERATAADQADRRARLATGSARQLAARPALDEDSAAELGIDVSALVAAWDDLSLPVTLDDAAALRAAAERLRRAVPAVIATTEQVRAAAAAELQAREDRWSPIAERLARWLDDGRAAGLAEPQVKALKAAERWLKEAHDDIRNERLRPLGEQAQAIWARLRHESNVDLGAIRLAGSATRRTLDIGGSVDGAPGQALGVMSQGEVNALALSLFLPRATLPESPFGFVIIDDPVQAMDPSKVDGLALALAEVAEGRQVVVFSHDDRLPAAVRRLLLPARIVQVQRRAKSLVEIVPGADPAGLALRDAKKVAGDRHTPPEVKQRVVPGRCRLGVEAALTAIAQRRMLRGGTPHRRVDEELAEATRMWTKAELAMFGDTGDEDRAKDELRRLGPGHTTTFRQLNEGAHGVLTGDPRGLVTSARALVDALEAAYP